MPLRSFIDMINVPLQDLIKGSKVFGLAQLVIRTSGTVQEILPGIVDLKGDIQYAGLDDVSSMRIYHRNTGITTAIATGKGFGDAGNDLINTYQMSMVVFSDQQKVKKFPDELFLYLQANIPEFIKLEPYKTIAIKIGSVILDSKTVFDKEYAGTDFKLPAEKNLFQINYTIESTFKKGCFQKCPDC